MQQALISDFCPHLGLKDDPDSSVAFPSYSNCCHHSQPVHAVRFDHQEEFCLTGKYRECPVFLRREKAPLPQHLHAHGNDKEKVSSKNFSRIALVMLGILAVILLLGWGYIKWNQPVAQASPTLLPTAFPLASNTPVSFYAFIEPTRTPRPTSAITSTPTLHLPLFGSVTPTKKPTTTPSITPIPFVSRHQLNLPIGIDRKFVIRRVGYGEKLDTYIQEYSTSFKAVSAINYYLRITTNTARADMLAVFPVGFADVSGMHALTVYKVPEEERGVRFEYIARKHKIDLTLFKYYNGITDSNERPMVGDYYLMPQQVIP
jgi:hypothetical protein